MSVSCGFINVIYSCNLVFARLIDVELDKREMQGLERIASMVLRKPPATIRCGATILGFHVVKRFLEGQGRDLVWRV
jgi:hypothetical protein